MAVALLCFFPWDKAANEFRGKSHFLSAKCIGFLPTCVFKVVRSTSLAGEKPISTKPCGSTSTKQREQQTRPRELTLSILHYCNHLKLVNSSTHSLRKRDRTTSRADLKAPSTFEAQSKSTRRPLRSCVVSPCIQQRHYPITAASEGEGRRGRQMTGSWPQRLRCRCYWALLIRMQD